MKRVVLLSLFLVLMIAEMLGADLSLGPGLSVKNAYLYLILLALGIELAVTKHEGRLRLRGIHVPFILLISYATFSWLVVSFIFPFSGYVMFERLITLKNQLIDHYLFLLVFFYGVNSAKDALWILKYMLWIVVVGNIITLVDVYNIPDLGIMHERGDGRVSGPLGQSNQYAAFLILFLPALVVAIWRAVGLKRVWHGLGFLASVAVLVLTTSRGAFIGLAGGLGLGTVYARHFIRAAQFVKTVIALTALALVVLLVLSYHYSDLLYERFIDQTGSKDIRYVTSGRSRIWAQALSTQMDKPITFLVGYGWGAYDTKDTIGHFRYATHNTYLNYLFDLGIIGVGLFLTIVGGVIRATNKGIRMSDESRAQLMAFLFGFLSLLVHIFFVDLYKPWLFVWAYTGLMMRVAVEASTKQVSMYMGRDLPNCSGTDAVLSK